MDVYIVLKLNANSNLLRTVLELSQTRDEGNIHVSQKRLNVSNPSPITIKKKKIIPKYNVCKQNTSLPSSDVYQQTITFFSRFIKKKQSLRVFRVFFYENLDEQ